MSTSPSLTVTPSQSVFLDDPMEAFVDYPDYDNVPFQSPSLSPATTTKIPLARPIKTEPQTSLMSTSQPLSGPSHQYDLYKQQTGIVPGALASTLAINQNNSQIHGYNGYSLNFLGMGNTDDTFDFNTAPSRGSLSASDLEMGFDSPPADPFFLPEDSTINPSSIGGHEPNGLPSPPILATQSSNVGRVWPGIHQQMAKAQQQRQQQIVQQQQEHQRLRNAQPKQPNRSKVLPIDPIAEQKITQLLNSMRAKSASSDEGQNAPILNISRPKKDEDDMDEDERLLASEEGKKLSSKERRQLRNKVSARAFRSRRKEYINHLEQELHVRAAEVGELRKNNCALVEENKRLTDLTRMLLGSPAFSEFLDRMSAKLSQPELLPQPQAVPQQHESRQMPKDINPYAAQQQLQQHHIGMATIPEQPLDFGMPDLNAGDAGSFNFLQPHVFAVLETPEPLSVIDTSVLSGKASNFVGEQFDSEEEKVEMPAIEKAPAMVDQPRVEVAKTAIVDEEFENDPAFALYHDLPATASTVKEPVELDTEGFSHVDIFGGIEPEKALARFELINATEGDAVAAFAMARVQRISASLDSVMARLEILTVEL